MAGEVALLLCLALLVTVLGALFSKSMSVTVIMLFYASIVLGLIFILYQGMLVGLLQIITFAGAISVMLLTVVVMTGESNLDIGKRWLAIPLTAVTILVVTASSYSLFSNIPTPAKQSPTPTLDALAFVWTLRPWDLLILIVIFAGAMIAIANLFSKGE